MGKKTPDFSLQATDGLFNLSEKSGSRVVIYFYPKDATPGCTIEGQDFTRLKRKFEKANTLVYGLSRDSLKSHENFKAKQNYTIHLISDPDEVACGIFGAIKKKKLYGREYRGLDRCTFVIDEKGYLIKEWRDVKVSGHSEEVLEFVQSL